MTNMSANLTAIITTLCSTLIPAVVTLITFGVSKRQARRDKGGSYILLLINEDYTNWHMFSRLPANYDAVLDQYLDYHKAGGNGKVTKSVERYQKWHDEIAKEIANKGKEQ